ncbi:MAG TPA: lactate utilization protein [Gemmataceae bacterium]|nr:lactate utilization protein [Gemmataceae bacterium]
MSSGRDACLQRVRQAVSEGNRAGGAPPLPERGTAGYQGAGPDPVARFRDELSAAGGVLHVVADDAAAVAKVLDLVSAKAARRALVGRGRVIDRLGLPERLRAAGVEVATADALPPGGERDTLFAADVGISGVDHLVAETGSLAVLARPQEPRSLSLLPPVHVAVADHNQLLPDLFDLFAALQGETASRGMPSCLSLITGPSKTGDIELRLVTGVHGPGELHVVFIDALR